MQLDSGSNANILCDKEAFALCHSSDGGGVIGGISSSLRYAAVASCSVSFGVNRALSLVLFLYAPRGARTIVSDPTPPAVICPAARLADNLTALSAARLGLGAKGLLRTARGSRGIDITAHLSPAQREAIGDDAHRSVVQF